MNISSNTSLSKFKNKLFYILLYIFLQLVFYSLRDTKDAANILDTSSFIGKNNPEFYLAAFLSFPFRSVLGGFGLSIAASLLLFYSLNYLLRQDLITRNNLFFIALYPTIFYWVGQSLKDGLNATYILLVIIFAWYPPKFWQLKKLSSIIPYILLIFGFKTRPLQYLILLASIILSKLSPSLFSFRLQKPRFNIKVKSVYFLLLLTIVPFFGVFMFGTLLRISDLELTNLFNYQSFENIIRKVIYARITRNDIISDGSGSDLFADPNIVLTQPFVFTYFTMFITSILGPITLLFSKFKISYMLTVLFTSYPVFCYITNIPKKLEVNHSSKIALGLMTNLVIFALLSSFSSSLIISNAGNSFRYSVYIVLPLLVCNSMHTRLYLRQHLQK